MTDIHRPGLVVLQDDEDSSLDATVNRGVVPPELKPVASDIVNKNCVVAGSCSCIENNPAPLANADVGIEVFCGNPKTYSVMKITKITGEKRI